MINRYIQKNNKQKIESFINALFIVFIQIIYMNLFGKDNILVGMIMAMGVISFLNRDLTNNLLYRTITFLILNIMLGILSYLSNDNAWVGFFIDFFTIFIITYIYMNDFRSPTSYIFIMLYIFMWASPILLKELPIRLLGLSFGVGVITLTQIIFNKNKFKTNSTKLINDISKDIQNQIYDIKTNKFDKNKNIDINNKIRKLLVLINGRSHRRVYHSNYEINKFNIAIYLDRLNLIINHVVKYKKDKQIKNIYLDDLQNQIKNISLFNENNKNIKEINYDINKFILKYENIAEKPLFLSESIHLLKIFKFNINNEINFSNNDLNRVYQTIKVPSEFKLINNLKDNFKLNSLKLTYSLKLALAISLTMLLSQLFNMEYGKWIVITTYVVMQPYQEDTILKAKDRFKGTFIGSILFILIFSLIQDIIPKMIVVGISFYYYYYFKENYKKTIAMTIISLSSISLINNISALSLNRIICIVIGVGIGLIFNKYFLPYSISDSIEELKEKYKQNNKVLLKELNKVIKGKGDLDKLIKLCLIENQIESKLISNNEKVKDKEIEKLIYKHSLIMSDARFLLLKIYESQKTEG